MINNYVLADLRLRFERAADDLSQLVKVDNNERYIECLVVVDQKMVNYHGEDAASQFALVVLNIVSDHDCITLRFSKSLDFLKFFYSLLCMSAS